MRKTLASILSEKATAVIKRIRNVQNTLHNARSKKKKSRKFVKVYGTPLIILS